MPLPDRAINPAQHALGQQSELTDCSCHLQPSPQIWHPKVRPLPQARGDGRTVRAGTPRNEAKPQHLLSFELVSPEWRQQFPTSTSAQLSPAGTNPLWGWEPGGTELGCLCFWGMQMGCCGVFMKHLRMCSQHSQGWQGRDAGNTPTLFKAHSPAVTLTCYPKKKVCMKWLRRMWNVLKSAEIHCSTQLSASPIRKCPFSC